jgi:hypothetical protein
VVRIYPPSKTDRRRGKNKKNNRMKPKLFIFALLALLVASCTDEIDIPEPATKEPKAEKEGEMVTINASIPQEARVAYDDANLSLSWQDNDQLLLAGYNGTTYKGSSAFTWQTGNTFTGTTVPDATTYKAYYPGDVITLDETTGEVQLPANFWGQTQNGNNTTGHLKNKLLLFDETAKPISQTFTLNDKSSIIKNVNPAGDGFVTDLTSCTGSGYFNWDEAKAISVPSYHLPSIEEWQGIVPLYADYVYYVLFNSASPSNGVTENVVVQGQSITMTSDFRRPGNNVSYALRYKGTDMVSAWKYELFHYNTNTCHMKITSRIVTSSEIIDNIATNPTYWTTGNENDIVCYFPASGYNTNSNLGKGGYFRSSTVGSSSLTWCMGFASKGAISYPGYTKTSKYTVRLFTPGN